MRVIVENNAQSVCVMTRSKIKKSFFASLAHFFFFKKGPIISKKPEYVGDVLRGLNVHMR